MRVTIRNAIDAAWADGVVLIAASGNDGCNGNGCVFHPAAYANVMAVGSVTSSGTRSSFSNAGPELDIAAPGSNIVAPWRNSNSAYATASGTSAAAPFVAAVAGLVWSGFPHLTNQQVRDLLEDTATPKTPVNHYGHGLINAFEAWDHAVPEFPLEVLQSANFDSGLPSGWSLSGQWRVSSLCENPPSPPSYLGYHRSTICDYDVIGGSSGNAIWSLDLSSLIEAEFEFAHFWDTEQASSSVDDMDVQISTNGGSSWSTLAHWDAASNEPSDWQTVNLNLDSFVGQNVQIRFRFASDALDNAHPGWFVDDVKLLGLDNYPPVARAGPDITVTDPDASGSESVTLDGSDSDDRFTQGGSVVDHRWFVGGAEIGTGPNPTVTLPTGSTTVTLRVTDNQGDTTEDIVVVTVEPNVSPTALVGNIADGSDPDGDGTGTVTLLDGGSSDPDGFIVDHAWFDGPTLLGHGTSLTTDLPVGTHTVTLRVIDNGGATHDATTEVTVAPNQAPIADPGNPAGPSDADDDGVEIVHLDGTSSADPDGSLVAYAWFEGETQLATTATADVPLSVGSHSIRLDVTDNGGLVSSDTVDVTVLPNQPPDAAFTTSCVTYQCTFHGGTSTDDGSVATYSWTFGDNGTGTGIAPAHTYGAEGHYEVCLTVIDGLGLSDQTCDTVVIRELIVHETFDAGLPAGFATTGLWHVSALCAEPRTQPSYLAYHRVGACNFNDGTRNQGSTTFTADLSGADAPVLWFLHDWDTSESVASWLSEMFVEVRPESSGTWGLLHEWHAGDPEPDDWLASQFDLSPWVGQTVDIRFRFDAGTTSSSWNNFPGWFIDVVEVGEPGALIIPNIPPVADARVGPGSFVDADGDGSATVPFDGASSLDEDGTIVDYTWRNQGNIIATGADPDVVMAVGTHEVELTVTDEDSATGTDTMTFTVHPNTPPVANAGPDLTLRDSDGTGTESTQLDGTASSDAEGTALTYSWRIGGTEVATGSMPTIDLASGTHIIQLAVTDIGGASDSDTVTIDVLPNVAPIAEAGSDQTTNDFDGTGLEIVPVDGSLSTDDDGTISSFEWLDGASLLGTGAQADLVLPVGVTMVTLRITDNGGATATDILSVEVIPNAPPSADAGVDRAGNDDDQDGLVTFALDATASSDDGGIVSYVWTEGATTIATGATPSVALGVGTHAITLTVTDAGGATDTDHVLVTVTNNLPPIAGFSASCGAWHCDLDGSFSSDPDDDLLTYTWDFGDGSTDTTSGPVMEHHFPNNGAYTVCLTVDDGGFQDQACVPVSFIGTIRDDDFETFPTDYTLDGLWHRGRSCSDANSGEWYIAFTNSLYCMYQTTTAAQGSATLPIDLSGASFATLEFDHRWITESMRANGRDKMAVEIQDPATSDWLQLAYWDSADPKSPQWRAETMQIPGPALGSPTEIRFTFTSTDALWNIYDGWYIDDVEIISDALAPPSPPTVDLITDCSGQTCIFDARGSGDDQVIVAFEWDYGDGRRGTGDRTFHDYAEPGTYTVRLTVRDNAGLETIETVNVTV